MFVKLCCSVSPSCDFAHVFSGVDLVLWEAQPSGQLKGMDSPIGAEETAYVKNHMCVLSWAGVCEILQQHLGLLKFKISKEYSDSLSTANNSASQSPVPFCSVQILHTVIHLHRKSPSIKATHSFPVKTTNPSVVMTSLSPLFLTSFLI